MVMNVRPNTATPGNRVTVAVVPRQRWSLAVRSLTAVIERMPTGTELIYVDGGSPEVVSDELRSMVESVDGVWIRRDCVLSGNEARNLLVDQLSREFVVFIDNDALPGDGWIERLVECADDTGAAVVGPLILHGPSEEFGQIHVAGGEIEIVDGVMTRNDRHHSYEQIDDVEDELVRCETTQLEFHSIMLRTDFALSIAPFDEALLTFGDHEDVVLLALADGLGVWFEPASRVTYLTMIRLDEGEVGYWQMRWCEDWNRRSLECFAQKWDIAVDEGWTLEARLWGTRERSRWYHGRGKLYNYGGKAVRLLNKQQSTARLSRGLEERLMSRRSSPEFDRRALAGFGEGENGRPD